MWSASATATDEQTSKQEDSAWRSPPQWLEHARQHPRVHRHSCRGQFSSYPQFGHCRDRIIDVICRRRFSGSPRFKTFDHDVIVDAIGRADCFTNSPTASTSRVPTGRPRRLSSLRIRFVRVLSSICHANLDGYQRSPQSAQ
jgi:hypothetical protein